MHRMQRERKSRQKSRYLYPESRLWIIEDAIQNWRAMTTPGSRSFNEWWVRRLCESFMPMQSTAIKYSDHDSRTELLMANRKYHGDEVSLLQSRFVESYGLNACVTIYDSMFMSREDQIQRPRDCRPLCNLTSTLLERASLRLWLLSLIKDKDSSTSEGHRPHNFATATRLSSLVVYALCLACIWLHTSTD